MKLNIGLSAFVLATASGLVVNGHAQTSLNLGQIPLGGVCLRAEDDPGPKTSWASRNALCTQDTKFGSACLPGPARRGMPPWGETMNEGKGSSRRVEWYCTRKDQNCAYPGKLGVHKGESIGEDLCTCDTFWIAGGYCQGMDFADMDHSHRTYVIPAPYDPVGSPTDQPTKMGAPNVKTDGTKICVDADVATNGGLCPPSKPRNPVPTPTH
jgi:hypothetical protein